MLWQRLTVTMKSHCGVNVLFWGRFKEVELRSSVCSLKPLACINHMVPFEHMQRPWMIQHSVQWGAQLKSCFYSLAERVYTKRRDTGVGCCKRPSSTFTHTSACSTGRSGPAQGVKRLLPLSGWERLHSRRVNQLFVFACDSLTCLPLFINSIRNAKEWQLANRHKTTTEVFFRCSGVSGRWCV